MSKLIKNGEFVADPWQVIEQGALESVNDYMVVHASDWSATAHSGKKCGLWLSADTGIQSLPAGLNTIPLIAIQFPAIMDGRGFSIARQIREQKNYQGEIRAIGNFFQDQVFMMKRCGIDAYLVADDADIESYRTTLGLLSEYYQAAADEPRPLFRRR